MGGTGLKFRAAQGQCPQSVNFAETEVVQVHAAALWECRPCGRKGMGHESPTPQEKPMLK